MLLEERDRFPIHKIMFYDNDAERQEIVAKACEIYLKENAPDIEFGYTPLPVLILSSLISVWENTPCANWMKRSQ